MTDENLKLLVAAAREKGAVGVCLISHSGRDYLAACMGKDGRPCDPRNWNYKESPTAALTDLGRLLGVALLGEPVRAEELKTTPEEHAKARRLLDKGGESCSG